MARKQIYREDYNDSGWKATQIQLSKNYKRLQRKITKKLPVSSPGEMPRSWGLKNIERQLALMKRDRTL